MSAGTFTISGMPADLSATQRRQGVAYAGPTSYATGGDPLTPNNLRMGAINEILGLVASNGTLTYLLWYNQATQKLMWFDMAGAEVAAAVNLSTFTARLEVVGR